MEREGMLEGKGPVTLMRVFSLKEVQQKGVEVTGWETFDQHPDLILLEGYRDARKNEAHLERKRA